MIATDTDRAVIDSLYRISSLMGKMEDPHLAFDYILDEIRNLLQADSATISLKTPEANTLRIEVSKGLADHSTGFELKLDQGITGWVALHGKAVLANNVKRDSRYFSLNKATRSEMAVPMVDQGTVIGVVNVESESDGAFDEQNLRVLSLLTNEATKVANRLWLISQLKRKSEQLESLIIASRKLVLKREQSDLMDSLTREALRITNCKISALYLYDLKKRQLILHSLADRAGNRAYEEILRVEDTAAGAAILHLKQIEVLDVRRTEEHHLTDLISSEGLVSMLCLPILSEEEPIGILNAYTDSLYRFDDEEKRMLSTLAAIGAVAIQNARLYSRVFSTEELLRRSERLSTLGLLSAELAHEIRNPLTVIRLLFDSLDLNYDADDIRSKDATIIKEKINQLDSLANRILEFGKSSDTHLQPVSLNLVVDETIHLLRLKLEQMRIELHYHNDGEALSVQSNKGQLQQVFLNLILNATKAMPHEGKIHIYARQESRGDDAFVVVEIRDSGTGIPDKLRDSLFASPLLGNHHSDGLGLNIVKRILQSHHGGIEVAHTSPEGTTMRIWLPMPG